LSVERREEKRRRGERGGEEEREERSFKNPLTSHARPQIVVLRRT
jgi:hypothetical protein